MTYQISPELIGAASKLLPDQIEVLAASNETNALGELVPGWTVVATTIGRLGVSAPRTPVVAGQVLGLDELVLSIPLDVTAEGDAFRINNETIVERRGPDINGLVSLRVVRRIPVRRTELNAPAAVED